jgi:hypothetical protein
VRTYWSADEEMGVRVRLTRGRGGGSVSGQITWQGGGSRRSSCSNGVEGEEGSGDVATGWLRRRRGNGGKWEQRAALFGFEGGSVGGGVSAGAPHSGGTRKERRGAGTGSAARPCGWDGSRWHCQWR